MFYVKMTHTKEKEFAYVCIYFLHILYNKKILNLIQEHNIGDAVHC